MNIIRPNSYFYELCVFNLHINRICLRIARSTFASFFLHCFSIITFKCDVIYIFRESHGITLDKNNQKQKVKNHVSAFPMSEVNLFLKSLHICNV